MYRQQVNQSSPLRILDQSIHGGLGPGKLGVVMARAGVGKTAFLVHIGLDAAMREENVLHVTTEQGLEHMQAWYDAIFDDLAHHVHLDDRAAARHVVAQHRMLHAYADHQLSPSRLEALVEMITGKLGFRPAAILLDGYHWEGPVAAKSAEIAALKALAAKHGARLWMSAQTHREQTAKHPVGLTPPCSELAHLIDVAVCLEPDGNHVTVRLLKDYEDAALPAVHLQLDCDTLRLRRDDDQAPASGGDGDDDDDANADAAAERPGAKLPAHGYTLLSGGNKGAEAVFGETAESWGVREVNFSYAGRQMERRKSVVELSPAELRQGDVSGAYVESHLHRKFPKTETFQNILRSIWHQVATAGQVFVVGEIQSDATVVGGTGWAAELARHFGKPLNVYDQSKKAWFAWTREGWRQLEGTPRIARRRFTGTGTRFLTDDGRAAIAALFQESFGSR